MTLKYIPVAIFICIAAFSCNDHEYYQENPNAPSSATPALLLTNICVNTFYVDPLSPAYSSRHLTYYERPSDAITYGWNSSSFGPFNTLRQVKKMQELAERSGEQNYIGISKFFRAFIFAELTETFGDVPYSESLKAEEGFYKPRYDKQEDIYAGILNELEEANTILDDSKGTLGGDIVYFGKASQWKKAVNALRLRLLIHLSKRADDSKINVKQQFNDIVTNPTKYPLFKSNADNAQLVFNESSPDNFYPIFNNLSVKSLVSLEEGFVNTLKAFKDERLFTFADPIQGTATGNFNNYAGVNAGWVISEQQEAAVNASKINSRYVANKINEPMILLGHAEQEFNIAEAKARGWTPGNAKDNYDTGIRSSMLFYGIGVIKIENYVKQPIVKYDASKYLEQIITQKHIAMFMNSSYEPFFEHRRTGYPNFNIGPATLNNGLIPLRWKYPQDEYDNNTDNLNAAINSQFGSAETVNSVMWLLK